MRYVCHEWLNIAELPANAISKPWVKMRVSIDVDALATAKPTPSIALPNNTGQTTLIRSEIHPIAMPPMPNPIMCAV